MHWLEWILGVLLIITLSKAHYHMSLFSHNKMEMSMVMQTVYIYLNMLISKVQHFVLS